MNRSSIGRTQSHRSALNLLAFMLVSEGFNEPQPRQENTLHAAESCQNRSRRGAACTRARRQLLAVATHSTCHLVEHKRVSDDSTLCESECEGNKEFMQRQTAHGIVFFLYLISVLPPLNQIVPQCFMFVCLFLSFLSVTCIQGMMLAFSPHQTLCSMFSLILFLHPSEHRMKKRVSSFIRSAVCRWICS